MPDFAYTIQVQLHPRRTSAVVVFALEKTVSNVLAAAKKGALVTFTTNMSDQQATGLRKLVHLHKAQYPGNQKLELELNSWMEAFETAEAQRKRATEAAAADDGWTVVTRKPGRKRKSGMLALFIALLSGLRVSGFHEVSPGEPGVS